MFNFFKDKSFVKNLIIGLIFISCSTIAATSSGMPWDEGLTRITDSISGPLAYSVSLIGIVGSAIALYWGGDDLKGVLRTVVYVVLVISIALGGGKFLAYITGASSAQIFWPY